MAGSGESDASQSIDATEVSNRGLETCVGLLYYKWYDEDADSPGSYAYASGWSSYLDCEVDHCYQSLSNHYFYESGSFGANPQTADGDDLDQQYCGG